MTTIVDNPYLVFLAALLSQWCAGYLGDLLRRKVRPIEGKEREDFNTVLSATLTLLALIIGFSFSMAVSRYDQRKGYEEAEANAIGTEYLRADLLSTDQAAGIRVALGRYLEQRIAFYADTGSPAAAQNPDIAATEAELWSAVVHAGAAQSNPVVALAVAGMNDVLNSQGYTRAAWLNRIPVPAWALMGLIALFANGLLGYRERKTGMVVLVILPVIVSIAFFLIADIDSPTGGVIRVAPQNLVALAQSIRAQAEPSQ